MGFSVVDWLTNAFYTRSKNECNDLMSKASWSKEARAIRSIRSSILTTISGSVRGACGETSGERHEEWHPCRAESIELWGG
jgi:hypothetical protein